MTINYEEQSLLHTKSQRRTRPRFQRSTERKSAPENRVQRRRTNDLTMSKTSMAVLHMIDWLRKAFEKCLTCNVSSYGTLSP
jgi:hypothetical protein